MKKFIFFIVLLFPVSFIFSQVGIGTTTPDPSSILHLESSKKGILPPRNTLSGSGDAVTIPNPATGLLVYHLGNSALSAGVYINLGTPSAPVWTRTGQSVTNTEGSKIYKTKYRGRNSYLQNYPKPTLSIPEMNLEMRFGDDGTNNYLQVRLLQVPTVNVATRLLGHWQGHSHNAYGTFLTFTPTNWNVWQNVGGIEWNFEWGYYYVISTDENRATGLNPFNYSMNMYGLCGYGTYGSVSLEPYTLAAEVF
ncbi:hypothetical protein [Chryseobacterium sp. ERMR1:04]|uniref:hypothetical protein n=1 Tax=Chryseobacterium sp. ERMR1:04 TaxID=1705393 RepID=UPI0006C847E9|nr:hypothetical protein [Chryseobacterium sp. ERMR1:04]